MGTPGDALESLKEQLYDITPEELRVLALEALLISDGPDRVIDHQAVKAERYDMMMRHMLSHDSGSPMSIVTVRRIYSDGPEHYLFEIACMAARCGWWDHWDERKEDWS